MTDTLTCLQVLNNNAVVATQDGAELIVTGWGVGFGLKRGKKIDQSKINRIYRPDQGEVTPLASVIADLPLCLIQEVEQAVKACGLTLPLATLVAITDHLHGVQTRLQQDQPLPEHPLTREVKHLFSSEWAEAEKLISQLNQQLAVGKPEYHYQQIPATETTALAMHLVGAGVNSGGVSETLTFAELYSQIFEVIDTALGITVDRDSASAARFATHMRYLLGRAKTGTQLQDGMQVLATGLRTEYPAEMACAHKVGALLSLRLETEISSDEITYLGLHIVRLKNSNQPEN